MGPYSAVTLLRSVRQQRHHVGHRGKEGPHTPAPGPPVRDWGGGWGWNPSWGEAGGGMSTLRPLSPNRILSAVQVIGLSPTFLCQGVTPVKCLLQANVS